MSFCYKLTTSTKFEVAIVIVILLNMVAMMVEHYKMDPTLVQVLEVINIIFTVIFVLECILKLFALRWYYFKSPWNVFDFIVVVFSVLGESRLCETLKAVTRHPQCILLARDKRNNPLFLILLILKHVQKMQNSSHYTTHRDEVYRVTPVVLLRSPVFVAIK